MYIHIPANPLFDLMPAFSKSLSLIMKTVVCSLVVIALQIGHPAVKWSSCTAYHIITFLARC